MSGASNGKEGGSGAEAEGPEATLRRLLAEHPEAVVFAVERNEFRRPAADHPGLADLGIDSTVLGPIEALELLHPDSRAVALTALDRIDTARAICDELYAADGSPIDSWFFDTLADRKLYLGLQIAAPHRAAVAISRPVVSDVPPRVVRIRTDGIGRIVSSRGAGSDPPRGLAPGQLTIDAVHADDIDQVRSVWAAMLANPGVAHRCRYRARVDDGWRWHEASITSFLDDPDDGTVHLEVVDITSEMAAHEEVRRRERTLRRLAEALPQAVVQLDRSGTAVYSNGRAVALLGPELDGLGPLLDAVIDDDRELLAAALEESLAGADHDVEVQLADGPDGEPMVVEVTLRGLSADEGEPDGVMCCIADVTERVRMRANLELRATFDQLTGVHNRGSLVRALAVALHPARTTGVAVVFVDLDGFKAVNDTHGHQAGDDVLRTVASELGAAVRANDVVGRIGGDEFVVVCPDVVDAEAATAAAHRIAHSLDPDRVPGLRGVRASIGVAWSDEAINPSELMSRADAAMYVSKREGFGRVVVADE